jgi:hypothetical protein
MTNETIASQQTLFEPKAIDAERILLYALGDFQSRGKVLAERPLPLDRLRGAFKRAAEKFETDELSDETIIAALEKMGARVIRKPSFVAKHPFNITISTELASRAFEIHREIISQNAEVTL